MEAYRNLGGTSGVLAFQIEPGRIRIQFRNAPKVYSYSDRIINPQKVDDMKRLAALGQGLGSYINEHADVRYGYE